MIYWKALASPPPKQRNLFPPNRVDDLENVLEYGPKQLISKENARDR